MRGNLFSANTDMAPNECHDRSKRAFLNTAVMFGLSASVGLPFPSPASADICRWCELSKLSPQRFIAGLILDTLSAVIVDYASREIINSLVDERSIGASDDIFTSTTPPSNEYYKGALIVAGEVDYAVYKNRTLQAIIFSNMEKQLLRLEQIKNYLKDNSIYIKSAYTSISYPVDAQTTEDDLLSVEYFTSPSRDFSDKFFLEDLERLTGVTALEKWSRR